MRFARAKVGRVTRARDGYRDSPLHRLGATVDGSMHRPLIIACIKTYATPCRLGLLRRPVADAATSQGTMRQ